MNLLVSVRREGRERGAHFVGFVRGDQADVFGGGETMGEFGAG
jgi:hypothetical protein